MARPYEAQGVDLTMTDARNLADVNATRNERLKLFATALNALATVAIGTSIIAPAVAITWNLPIRPGPLSTIELLGGLALWLFVSVALHIGGQLALATVRQP